MQPQFARQSSSEYSSLVASYSLIYEKLQGESERHKAVPFSYLQISSLTT